MSQLTVKKSELAATVQSMATFTKHASDFAAKVAERDKAAAEQKKAADALIPDVVQALVLHGRIDKSEAKLAAECLADPIHCLNMMKNMADPVAGSNVAPMGAPVDKTAGVGPTGGSGNTADEVFDNILFDRS